MDGYIDLCMQPWSLPIVHVCALLVLAKQDDAISGGSRLFGLGGGAVWIGCASLDRVRQFG